MDNKKKVLVISIPFSDNYNAVRIRHLNIFNYLKNNHDVKNIEFENKLSNNIKIFKSYYLKLKVYLNKILGLEEFNNNELSNFETYLKNYLGENKTDSIIILLRPFYLLRLTIFLKENFPEIKIIVDMSDPPSLGYGKFFHKNKYINYFENKFLKPVDCLIVPNISIKKYYNNITKNVEVIEYGVDEYSLNFEDMKIQNNNKVNGTKLIYGGKFHKGLREPDELFLAISDSKENIFLEVYTDLTGFSLNKSNFDLNKIFFEKPISQESLFKQFHNSDIIVHLDNFYGYQVPGKTLELLSFEKPILLVYDNEFSDTLSYLRDQPGVFIVKNDRLLILEKIKKITSLNGEIYKRDFKQFYWSNLLSRLNLIIRD